VRKFPEAPELARMMTESGFAAVDWEYLTFGIAALHIGRIQQD
jgi:ubiquinone/menaquinone biosynthesis C-methylase UbiE